MRIAYLSNGNNIYDYRFIKKMTERGYEPYLISYWPDKVKFWMSGVKFIHHDPHFPRLPRIVSHLRKILKEINPDILHTGYVQTNGFYGALSGFHPILLMPWGSDILIEPDKSLYKRMMTKFTIRRANMITCDCQLVKNKIMELTKYADKKIIVFPWGIDLKIFKPISGPSAIRERLGWKANKVLIMTRNFKPIYGIEYFIDALPLIIQKEPKTRVVLVGSGPLEDDYRKRVNELNLDSYVYFAGKVNESQMAEYLNSAEIYVTSSLSDGTSSSLLEAMACQLPVVVSDAPAYFEWVIDGVNGFIVPRRDSVKLAERLIQLLDDDSLRVEMGHRNLQIVKERADWQANFSKLERMYEKLVYEGP